MQGLFRSFSKIGTVVCCLVALAGCQFSSLIGGGPSTTTSTTIAGSTTTTTLAGTTTTTTTAATAIPNAPANVVATAGNAFVTLTWDPSPGAASYTVYVASSAQANWKTMPVYIGGSFANATSPYKASSTFYITNGTACYFVVTATNSFGESGYPSPVVNATPSASAITATAKDGLTWSGVAAGTTQALTRIAYSGSMYVAAAGSVYDSTAGGGVAKVVTSSDRTTWTLRTADNRNNTFNALVYGGGKFMTIGSWGGSQGDTSLSTDGITWTYGTKGSSSVATNIPPYCSAIAYSPTKSLYVAVGSGISSSPDGLTWTSRSATSGLNNVIWAGNQFVAVGNYDSTSKILTSPDGITWTRQTATNTTKNLFGLAWSGSLLVAVGGMGAVWTSPDGVAWTDRSVGDPTNHQWSGVTWSSTKSLFAATEKIGGYPGPYVGVVDTSADGIAWAPSYVATGTTDVKDITWDGTRFVAVGGAGMIFMGQ